jgi:hypothetical protein
LLFLFFFFFFRFFLVSLVLWAVHYKQELQSGLTRWLACRLFFIPLSTGQVAIGTWGNSLPVYARWLNLLFSPSSFCFALPLQLWLAGFSPSKVRQWVPPSVPWNELRDPPWLCFGRLACHPTLSLSLCYLSCLSSLSLAPCPTPILEGRFSVPPRPHC